MENILIIKEFLEDTNTLDDFFSSKNLSVKNIKQK